jgi:hypothetical protein
VEHLAVRYVPLFFFDGVQLTGEDIADWNDTELPPAPTYLRILYLEKVLQDDETLSSTLPPPISSLFPTRPLTRKRSRIDLNIPTHPDPAERTPSTIVHLSFRPAHAPPPDTDALKKKKSRRRTASEGGGGGPESGRRLALSSVRRTMRRCVLDLGRRVFIVTYGFL